MRGGLDLVTAEVLIPAATSQLDTSVTESAGKLHKVPLPDQLQIPKLSSSHFKFGPAATSSSAAAAAALSKACLEFARA
jgi:hypothetical protein